MLNADTETTQVFPFVTKDFNSFFCFGLKLVLRTTKERLSFSIASPAYCRVRKRFCYFGGTMKLCGNEKSLMDRLR